MELPRVVIGPPVRGHDLWDREREIGEIWKGLETSSVLLSAPRRFGKTSIMVALADRPKTDWQTHYLDVEWIKGPEDFVAEIMAALLEQHGSRELLQRVGEIVGRALDRIEEVEVIKVKLALRKSLQEDWQDKGKALIKLLREVEQRIILIVDELPLLLLKIAKKEGPEHAEEFLFWLRGLRYIPELHDRVRWVFGGSIGIEKVLQRVGAGTKTINDLYVLRIREFSDETAKEFVKALLQKELAEIAKTLLSELAQVGSLSKKELWNLYMQRTQGKGEEDDFSYLLSDLENDFYVIHDAADGRYRFATKVLQDWWLRHHVA